VGARLLWPVALMATVSGAVKYRTVLCGIYVGLVEARSCLGWRKEG
jgi:hypothetical protein